MIKKLMNKDAVKVYDFYDVDHKHLDEIGLHNELRAGDLCPVCLRGRLDYDGMLNLSCEVCGFALSGCFT
jgi:hypothetical protein